MSYEPKNINVLPNGKGWKIITANHDREIAEIDMGRDRAGQLFEVIYGPGFRRWTTFSSFDEALRWIDENVSNIEDGAAER